MSCSPSMEARRRMGSGPRRRGDIAMRRMDGAGLHGTLRLAHVRLLCGHDVFSLDEE